MEEKRVTSNFLEIIRVSRILVNECKKFELARELMNGKNYQRLQNSFSINS